MSFGLRPYNAHSGGYQSGGFTEYPILDGDATSMFTGGLALQGANGMVTALALTPTGASAVLSTVGVFTGFRYVDADGTPRHSQQYVGNAGNTEAFAFVADDPNQIFLVQADGAVVQTTVGLNAPIVSSTGTATAINQGVAITGLSTNDLDFSAAAVTATLALRILGIPKDGENDSSATPVVTVKFNPVVHQLTNALGL